jgi:Na+/melibiose symporter-like transporter
MLAVAPQSAKLIERFGSRITLLSGYVSCLIAFLVMLITWKTNSGYAVVAIAFILLGVGVGIAGTPASHSLTGSVPVHKAGMASGTADLQRDLGGAIMQSILGAILTAGYASAVATKITASGKSLTNQTTNLLERSFSSAAAYAKGASPADAQAIIAGAKDSFLQGANWAYASGVVLILVGGAIVWFFFPKKAAETDLLADYFAQDTGRR